jgi:hypothetical protein
MSVKCRDGASKRSRGRQIEFHAAEPICCPGCHQWIEVTPCPACLARAFSLGLVSRCADREEKQNDPLRLELAPEQAARAADIRSGRIVLSVGAVKSLQGQAVEIGMQSGPISARNSA